MPSVSIAVVGARRVELRFAEFPQQAHDAILRRITRLTAELAQRVEEAEPQRSGRLKASTESKVFDTKTEIDGRVFITGDFAKAAALEFGAHKTARVKAHPSRLGHVFSRMISPMTVIVAAHSRTVNIAERKYLRGPLDAMSGQVISELEAALVEAGVSE